MEKNIEQKICWITNNTEIEISYFNAAQLDRLSKKIEYFSMYVNEVKVIDKVTFDVLEKEIGKYL